MPKLERNKVGELRPSQLLFTFGVGAVVELPHLSVIQMGLEDWDPLRCPEIEEPRLVRAVQKLLGPMTRRLRRPPPAPDSDALEAGRIGVPVTLFPRWVRCPVCNLLAPVDSGPFQLKANPHRPDWTRYVHVNCPRPKSPPTVLAARYLVACDNGHLDDFPWDYYLHQGTSCPGPLRLFEVGASGSSGELFVKCSTCEVTRPLAQAFDGALLGPCLGRHPHLRLNDKDCQERPRPLLVGASNAWFPIRLSVLSIPTIRDPLTPLVQIHRTSFDDCQTEREAGLVSKAIPALAAYPAAEVWKALQNSSQPSSAEPDPDDLRGPEWRLFRTPAKAPVNRDLTLRDVPPPAGFENVLAQVVLAERLREVHALVGFTRLESPDEFGEADDVPVQRRVKIARTALDWVPSVEIRGEGIFLRFREEAIEAWRRREAVLKRERALFRAHQAWRRLRRLPSPDKGFPGIRHALLHSFSHALMRQFALECGYSASSMRERIYSLEPEDGVEGMAGVLIYTAAPDCDGTLGGLVSLGHPEKLAAHLQQALEAMRLCAGDPLCADHLPEQAGLDVHGATCHACLFAPETSCEKGNRYLDRCLLVETLSHADLAFFGDWQSLPEAAPAEPAAAPALELSSGPSLPAFEVTSLLDDNPVPIGARPSSSTEPNLFWLQIPDDSLNKIVQPNTWCLFRWLTPDDDLPQEDTLCVVRAEDRPVVRRFFWSERQDESNQVVGTRVLLRPRSTNADHRTLVVEVSSESWKAWRPIAQFVSLEEVG